MAHDGKREGAGRKNNNAREGRGGYYNSRISHRLRAMLDDAAAANGVSLSAEISRRLEMSFTDPAKNDEAMKAIDHAASLVGPDVMALLAAARR